MEVSDRVHQFSRNNEDRQRATAFRPKQSALFVLGSIQTQVLYSENHG